MVGGVYDIVERGLHADGTYDRFHEVVHREWSRVFPHLSGEELPFMLPSATIPVNNLPDFTTCSL
jgi:hypothetical protein